MYVVVVQKFTFAISSPDEFLFFSGCKSLLYLSFPHFCFILLLFHAPSVPQSGCLKSVKEEHFKLLSMCVLSLKQANEIKWMLDLVLVGALSPFLLVLFAPIAPREVGTIDYGDPNFLNKSGKLLLLAPVVCSKLVIGLHWQFISLISTDSNHLLCSEVLRLLAAPCGLRCIMHPWFICWFQRCLYCLLVYMVCFPTSFFFTFFPYLHPYLPFPLRIDPICFQARCRKRWLNLASVFWIYFEL